MRLENFQPLVPKKVIVTPSGNELYDNTNKVCCRMVQKMLRDGVELGLMSLVVMENYNGHPQENVDKVISVLYGFCNESETTK